MVHRDKRSSEHEQQREQPSENFGEEECELLSDARTGESGMSKTILCLGLNILFTW